MTSANKSRIAGFAGGFSVEIGRRLFAMLHGYAEHLGGVVAGAASGPAACLIPTSGEVAWPFIPVNHCTRAAPDKIPGVEREVALKS